MKSKTMRHLFCRSAFAACLMGTAVMLPSCEDDALTGQPSWLGNSIYEELEKEGNYQTTLKLIRDLGQYDVLSQTGSKTLFVANDEAYEEWYKTNEWGVKSYEQLTMAQKKLLFNSSMVNNAYLVELLSNVSGADPGERAGKCMRRPSAVSIYDSVFTLMPEDMPVYISESVSGYKDPWSKHRGKNNGVVLMKDNNAAPMIHFLPAFMSYNKITDQDLSIMTNGKATSAKEAWVNGIQIVERDITCKNGYIHKVAGVIEPTVNMAEYIRQQGRVEDERLSTGLWSRMIDRFSAPFYNDGVTKEYNRLYNNTDSVFVLRYFSEWSAGGSLNMTPDGERVADLLPFDPGWNTYMYNNTSNYTMYYDAGVMIVPTDSAMHAWFDGEGHELQEQFGDWDSIPAQTLKELLGANMIESFIDKVPSKFDNILDASTQLPLGITPADVKMSYMGCNGVVFVTNKVFTPRSYSSVAFPAMIREETLKVIYWAFDNLDFLPYLNSMDSYYSLLLPTNNAMLWYVDPSSYGTTQPTMLEFYYDKDEKRVNASRYNCTIDENGVITPGMRLQAKVATTVVEDRLNDLIDQLIIVGDIEDGNEYYKTKGGTPVRVTRENGQIQIQGLWQAGYGRNLTVRTVYDKTEKGNGKSYEIDEQMPLASEKSVYNVLLENPEYEEFLNLFFGGDPNDAKNSMMIQTMSNNKYACAGVSTGNYNVRLFENYNYTVYVPTNEAIRDLIEKDSLPTWTDFEYYDSLATQVDDATPESIEYAEMCKTVIKERITDFIRYHLQDNSVIIGAEPVTAMAYESMLVNDETGRFYGLDVTSTHHSLEVVDQMNQVHHVVLDADKKNYNQICREFWFTAAAGKLSNSSEIYMESDAVVHQVDGVLRNKWYKETWEQEADRRLKEGGTK